jgi:hypothetical protein
MGEWKLRPGSCVVQVVYADDEGGEHVIATAEKPRPARRLLRRLERKYSDPAAVERLIARRNGGKVQQ